MMVATSCHAPFPAMLLFASNQISPFSGMSLALVSRLIKTAALALGTILFFSPYFVLLQAQTLTSSKYFEQKVQPVLRQYCYPCHSSEKHKGDFDMESFSSITEVKRHPKV